MRAVDLILKKRDGGAFDREEIRFIVDGATSRSIPDYQIAAWLMAVVIRGMTDDETAALTDAMVASGERLDLSGIPGPKVDKHSTGGVGDKTSLILAPLVAACGAQVPMMSGRGLGHTGGTLDKLESIPGFRTDLSTENMKVVLAMCGCTLVGQTARVAPADRVLYALRDVTGTVESIPLITASIMSKKIAEGIDALVLDVKTGNGAFMTSESDARALARSLVSIGERAGVATEAVITRMDAPLGRAVGNALEVIECLDVMKGDGPSDVTMLSLDLAARMLEQSGMTHSIDEAASRVRRVLESGAGLDRFRQVIERQGGDPRVVDDYRRLPSAPERHMVRATRRGYLSELQARAIGRASVALGAGRNRVDDVIDPSVGIVVCVKPGEEVREGDGILELHFRDQSKLAAAAGIAARAIVVSDSPPVVPPLIVAGNA